VGSEEACVETKYMNQVTNGYDMLLLRDGRPDDRGSIPAGG
jgi:hypothetical protein